MQQRETRRLFSGSRLSLLLLLACVVLVGRHFYHHQRVVSLFWSAERGTTRSNIETAIGVPDKSRPIPTSLWWGDDRDPGPKNYGECAVWVSYEFFLDAYAFGYSDTGQLVAKYHYASE